ncbi:MAG: hypothetical protein AAF368_08425 [Planctomycetota bacterium]
MKFALKVLGLTTLFTVASWFLLATRTDEDPKRSDDTRFPVTAPPETDLISETTREYLDAQLNATLELQYGVPEVQIVWSTASEHPFAELREEETQSFATAFWPNKGLWLSDSTLIVAGVTRETGHTVLERWTFESGADLPRAEWISEESGLVFLLPDRAAVERIYEGDEPGARHVHDMIHNHGRPGTLFASFKDSNHIYSIAEGAATRLSWIEAPNTEPLSLFDSEQVGDNGFAYTLFFGPASTGWSCGTDLWSGQFVEVLDEDGDGTLDRVVARE